MVRRAVWVPVLLALFLGSIALSRAQNGAADVVLRPGSGATVFGGWTVIPDAAAAGGTAVRHANAGAAKLTQALAQPVNYFEQTFVADAGIPYRLWLRGRAQSDGWANDSVFVQFNTSVEGGVAKYRLGTTSALEVNLEDCSGCGLAGWGWQDTGWGIGVLGPEVVFASSGTQRIRIQTREDGFTIDQIVLSPERYLRTAPGALKNDTTIVPTGGQSSLTVVRRPYLQQMTSNRVVVVWATRESGVPKVRVAAGSTTRTVTGTSRLVPNSRSGLGFDYYHHEVAVGSLSAATAYTYDATVNDAPVTSATFRTAPATGTGDIAFVAIGDSGTGSPEQRQIASLLAADTYDLMVHAGDIAYGNSGGTGDASYRTFNDWFFDIYAALLPSRALYTTEGNHDSRPSNGNGVAYLDAFTLPTNGASPAYPDHAERYYSFDYGRVHFVALDTEFAFQDATRRSEQISWLESDLAATAQPWKIAVFHRSPYSAGAEHGSDLVVRGAFGPIFEQSRRAAGHLGSRAHLRAGLPDSHVLQRSGRDLHRHRGRRRSGVRRRHRGLDGVFELAPSLCPDRGDRLHVDGAGRGSRRVGVRHVRARSVQPTRRRTGRGAVCGGSADPLRTMGGRTGFDGRRRITAAAS